MKYLLLLQNLMDFTLFFFFCSIPAYCHSRNSLSSLCSYITGDALLFSMFREEATPVACPFHGPMTFTYNRGHGRCSTPVSNVDACTDESRLLFKYQACPDVYASESTGENNTVVKVNLKRECQSGPNE